jgi:glycosyltransferase involved in cell wall biosynthesis
VGGGLVDRPRLGGYPRRVQRPLRILRVIARLNVGGPALHVSYLTRGLDERGYETTLVAGSVSEGEGSMDYAVREQGIEPVWVPQLQRDVEPGADLGAVRELRRLIRDLRPDIVHTHTAKAGAVGRLAAVSAGRARPRLLLHTFHGHVLRGYFDEGRTRGYRAVERGLARVSDALVAVSPQVRDDLVELGVAPAERFEVIRLGLDLDARVSAAPGAGPRERERHGIPADAFVVGWLGRMTEIKRVDDLLRAFGRVAADVPRAHLLLAGDGPLRAQLEAEAVSLGIDERTHFVGLQQDVAPVYAACDVVALCSANEGTPVSLIEALAAGVPVVSTDVGGVGDVVRADETGLLVPAGDVPALGDALARLADDEALHARLAAEAPADVRARYSVERLVDDVDELYRRLLAEKGRGRIRMRTTHAPLAPALPRLEPAPSAGRPLRILLLSQYFPPEVGATQSRMQAFAEYLASRGHEVTVICEFPNHPRGVVPDEYRGRLYEDDRSNAYRVLRVWVKASRQKTQRTRMAFYLSYMALASAMAPVVGRVDVVVATTPPLFTGVAGLTLARLNRAPFVLDVRDLWPAAAVSLRQISTGRSLRLAEWLERLLYRQAAAVVAVTRPFCAHVDRIRGKGPATTWIPNGTLELFLEAEPGDGREALGAGGDEFLVTFAGTHGIAQGLGTIVDAAPALEGEARFALVGDGPVKEPLRRLAAERGVVNVDFHPQVPLAETPPLLAASDALLVPLSAHPTFQDFVPSKLIDAMAAGRPVVLSAAGESARIVEEAGAGVVAAPEDPDELARAVRWLRDHPEEAEEMGRRGREYARSRLRSVQAARLEDLLLEVTERR